MLNKLSKLKEIINNTGGAVIAFSGGVDSTFLLKVAKDVLSNNIIAVIGDSDTFPRAELSSAISLARDIGVSCRVIQTEELSYPCFVQNSPDRCYFCKKELFGKIKAIAVEMGYHYIFDGSNADDQNDFRPGMRAAREAGVVSPLKEAGLTKAEIRMLSKDAGLPTWDKPSMACLSSRFPYGTPITKEDLFKVEKAEEYLKKSGLRQVRVRIHGPIARIEVEKNMIPYIINNLMEDVVSELSSLGFTYITLDLKGFQSGSMNQTLRRK